MLKTKYLFLPSSALNLYSMKKILTLLLIGSISRLYLCAQEEHKEAFQQIDLSHHFNDAQGCFVLYDLKQDTYQMYQPDQCQQRFSPCSTFKIPNSLIALQTGVADDVQFKLRWDSIRTPAQPWMYEKEPFMYWPRDHTLQSAIKYSVVWYYQELARRIGMERMNDYLQQMDYGNQDASSAIDRFWLCGSLKISAKEQVDFLKKFYMHELSGFSVANMKAVKEIIRYESNDRFRLYGKTGGGDCMPRKVIGWYVGWVETDDNTYLFAMNMLADDFSAFDQNRRIEVTRKVLQELNIIY